MVLAASLLLALTQRGPADLPLTWRGYANVDPMAAEAGLPDLRKSKLPEGDLELRVWSGFSWSTRGLTLRRTGDAWRADRIDWINDRSKRRGTYRLIAAPAPKRGWAALWRELESRGLRTIPDEASLPDDGVKVFDGSKYLFQLRIGEAYRAYWYDNPEHHTKKPDAMRVAKIVRVLNRDLPGAKL